MMKWLVVDHHEAGVLVLRQDHYLQADPTIDAMTQLHGAETFSQALQWIESERHILTGHRQHYCQGVCSWGPGALAFAIVRDRRFGLLQGVFTRSGALPKNLIGGESFVESFVPTQTAALMHIDRREPVHSESILI